MIVLLNLKEESFHYHGEKYTRNFPEEYLLCLNEDTETILGFAKIDLLDNALLETKGDDAEIEHNLYLLAMHRFYEMGEKYMTDKRHALMQRINLELPAHSACK